MGYVLGIDLGTSALKALLLNRQGELVSTATVEYPLLTKMAGYSEQDPALWLDAAEKAISQIIDTVGDAREKLAGISFSGQMHSLVVLDAEKKVLRPAILWNDVRTTKQCQQIMQAFGSELLEITKNRALEGFTLPKILWLQANEPALWERVRHILLPKDYLRFWLTGHLAMDYSDAAGTLLLDEEQKVWSTPILHRFQIPADYLPELVESVDFTGYLRPELQQRFGLKNSVKIFAGGADNACAALGAGILHSDLAMASLGTSGVFLALAEKPTALPTGDTHLFYHALPNTYYAMGVTLAAGQSLNWFKQTFAPQQTFSELLAGIAKVPIGSKGLLFTPYIMGERTPYADSEIRGSFIGMSAEHQLSHFTRAVLEGITCSLHDAQQLIEQQQQRVFKKIVALGGGAKNADWLQIQADIFQAEMLPLKNEQGPGIGAAMLAAVGLGWFASFTECAASFVQYGPAVHPNPASVAKYQELYPIYQQIYAATKPLNQQLAVFRAKK